MEGGWLGGAIVQCPIGVNGPLVFAGVRWTQDNREFMFGCGFDFSPPGGLAGPRTSGNKLVISVMGSISLSQLCSQVNSERSSDPQPNVCVEPATRSR